MLLSERDAGVSIFLFSLKRLSLDFNAKTTTSGDALYAVFLNQGIILLYDEVFLMVNCRHLNVWGSSFSLLNDLLHLFALGFDCSLGVRNGLELWKLVNICCIRHDLHPMLLLLGLLGTLLLSRRPYCHNTMGRVQSLIFLLIVVLSHRPNPFFCFRIHTFDILIVLVLLFQSLPFHLMIVQVLLFTVYVLYLLTTSRWLCVL